MHYYESQYKEISKELDYERRAKRRMEDRVNELEGALH